MSFYGNIFNIFTRIKIKEKTYEPVDGVVDLSDAVDNQNQKSILFRYDPDNKRLIISYSLIDSEKTAELGKAKLGFMELGYE